jgi:predicted nucleic acid-binding protein
MTEVLIDTSAWIQFFREKDDSVSSTVETLVEADRAVMTGVVMTELLQGTRSEKEARQLAILFSVLPFIEVERMDWQAAGEILRKLRARGVTIPLTDAVIGTVAHRRGLAVLTTDPHFKHLPVEKVSVS